MSRIILLLLFVCVLCECRRHEEKKGKHLNASRNRGTRKEKSATASQENNEDDEKEDTLQPLLISKAYLKFRPLSLPLNISDDDMLRALIPGRYYHGSEYTSLVAWTTERVHAKERDYDTDDNWPFPDAIFNQTKLSKRLSYTDDNGEQYCLAVLSTSNHNEILLSGRFSCAYLGIAVFKKSATKWDLQSFDPEISCMGQFAQVPEARLIKLGKNNFGISMENSIGGGGQYEADIIVLSQWQNKWKLVLETNTAAYGGLLDTSINFTSDLSAIPHSSNNNFNNLSVLTKGVIYTPKEIDSSGLDLSALPTELITTFKNSRKDSLHFEVMTIYKFNGEEYKQMEQAVEKVE